ncbi:tyrosine-type recombinase/integrase [Azospirillum sp.]|uniref:tyrosine-type recombinase/integrase n=1 Tax=Azospirillum sp. TaxID=34012 RepID=UPI002D3B8F3C|nr:tyrosine-type recombinase/integrase [Azospirillum sp.]HYD67571.1 tyrosine-type recombinase/integrase [Azospirillum sp.]
MQARISKRVVDGTQPSERDVFVWDTEAKGFGLKVTPAGKKVYILQYRVGGGSSTPKRYTIGPHGTFTPDSARTEAERLLRLAAEGKDPADDKRKVREKALTIADLADRYLSDHVEVKNRPTTAAEFRRLLDKHIKPALGRLAVEKVTSADVAKLHHKMRSTPRQANQTAAVLSKMFSLAEVWHLRPKRSNPCEGIERYREVKRERFLTEAEIAEIGQILAKREGIEHPSILNALRLLLLTGCRLSEVLGLRWEEVDLEAGALAIPEERGKAGGRLHPIGAQIIAFMSELKRDGKWVFPSPNDPKKPLPKSTITHAWERIREAATVAMWRDLPNTPTGALVAELEQQLKRTPTYAECQEAAARANLALPAGITDARLHDMRHTVGTYAGQAGANAFLVRDKLGHKTLAMTGRYVNRDADPLRDLSDKVEGRISAALGAKRQSHAPRKPQAKIISIDNEAVLKPR